MADESVRSLTTRTPTTQLQSFSEYSVFEDLSIELPDLEETQIIDNNKLVYFDLFSVLNYCILRSETKRNEMNKPELK